MSSHFLPPFWAVFLTTFFEHLSLHPRLLKTPELNDFYTNRPFFKTSSYIILIYKLKTSKKERKRIKKCESHQNTINNINISIEYIYLGYNINKKGG